MFNKKWNKRFLKLARHISEWSKDPSTKCGAVIIRPDKTIVSSGYNGFGKRIRDNPKLYKNRKKKYGNIIHAEKNAVIHTHENLEGCTLFTYPMPPCERCCNEILEEGIINFVWSKPSKALKKRWGKSFKETKKDIKNAGGKFWEINL